MLEKIEEAAARKQEHIRICLQEDVDNPGRQARPFDNVTLPVEAWPRFYLNDISTKTLFLQREFSSPLLITGMTGGVQHARDINLELALAACAKKIPMGLGSLKMLLSDQSILPMFDVKSSIGQDAKSLFLIGNIGLVSFNHGITIPMIQKLVDTLKLDAFAIHLNALQEAIQPEGERNFSNLEKTLEVLQSP